jgi:hypothetical protein
MDTVHRIQLAPAISHMDTVHRICPTYLIPSLTTFPPLLFVFAPLANATMTHSSVKVNQITYNVRMRRVRATSVAVKKGIYIAQPVCIYSLRYPACNTHAPYFTFPHYLIKGAIVEKTLLNMNCEFRVSLQLLSEIRFILR